jgi:hypothetical protein
MELSKFPPHCREADPERHYWSFTLGSYMRHQRHLWPTLAPKHCLVQLVALFVKASLRSLWQFFGPDIQCPSNARLAPLALAGR